MGNRQHINKQVATGEIKKFKAVFNSCSELLHIFIADFPTALLSAEFLQQSLQVQGQKLNPALPGDD